MSERLLVRRPSEAVGATARTALESHPTPLPLRLRWIVGGLLAVHLLITAVLSARLSISLDETSTLYTTGAGLTHAVGEAVRYELQPPLYFGLVSLWRSVDDSLFWARLFSIVSAGLTVLVAGALARRFLKDVSPVWIVAAMAVNPFLIWTAVEARVYAFAALLSGLLLLFWHDGFFASSGKRWARLAYGLTAVAALYTQYYLGFLLVANAVPLVLLRQWRPLRNYLGTMLLTAACFAPMGWVVPSQVSNHTDGTVAAASVVEAARHVTSLMRVYSVQFEQAWLDVWQTRLWSVALGLVLVGLAVRHRTFFARERLALWTATATVALMYFALAQWTGMELAAERHLVGLFLPALLSMFAVLRAAARPAVAAWAVLIVGVNANTLAARYEPMAKRGDWQRVADAIMQHEQPGQPILVFQGERARPFRHHYRGRNVVVPLPPAAGETAYDLNRLVLHSPTDVADALNHADPHHECIWLVRNGKGEFAGCDFHPEILDAFVEKHYAVEKSLEFYKTQVKLLRRKPHVLTTSATSP